MGRRTRRCGGYRFIECFGHGATDPHVHIFADHGTGRLGTWSIEQKRATEGLVLTPRLRRCLRRLRYELGDEGDQPI